VRQGLLKLSLKEDLVLLVEGERAGEALELGDADGAGVLQVPGQARAVPNSDVTAAEVMRTRR
jgi:hypothetical protein